MTKKKIVSVVLDDETLKKVKELQKKDEVFSLSRMLRELITKGLQR